MLVIEPTKRIPIPHILKHRWLRNIDGFDESNSEEDDDHDF